MDIPFYQVDSFTDTPFTGNPAGVCVLPGPLEPCVMQNIAMEVNLPETAFLEKKDDTWLLRWFTPAAEVDLCGHATLAGAHVLWQTGRLGKDSTGLFHTKSGLLTAASVQGKIQLDFPAEPAKQTPPLPGLNRALGIEPVFTGKNRFDYILELETPDMVRTCAPDFSALKKALPGRGVIITSRSPDQSYDFVSRFFAPGIGIDEDPVTGSAHCCLGPFWAGRLGKTSLTGFQASKRTGIVQVFVHAARVHLTGNAVLVIKGTVTV